MRRNSWILILAVALAACGQKEPPPASPDLSKPERTSSSGALSGLPKQLPAEAEVTASSGPVQLTLRLYKTRLKAKKELSEPFDPAKSFLYQLELKNIGKKRFLVTADLFTKWPGDLPYGLMNITLDVVGPDGGLPYMRPSVDVEPPKQGDLPVPGDKEGMAMEAKWRREGVDPVEMIQRFNDRAKERYKEDHPEGLPQEDDGALWLEPGASTTTAACVHPRPGDSVWGRNPIPVERFAEVYGIDTRTPGKYRVRAVYDYELDAEFLREFSYVSPNERNVKFATPFIEFEVVP